MAQTVDAASAEDDGVTLTLPDLPDVALLHLLSYLRAEDLVAVALASTRLDALIRTHAPLWAGNKGELTCEDVEGLFDVLRLAPPMESLFYEYAYTRRTDFVVRFSHEGWPDWFPPNTLMVRAPRRHVECFKSILAEWGPRLKYLRVSGLEHGLLLEKFFAGLRAATALETLHLHWYETDDCASCTVRWPQEVVLPRLVNLHLEWSSNYLDDWPDFDADDADQRSELVNSTTLFVAVRSLIQAHSGQLRFVELGSCLLLPLLSSCARTLEVLSIREDDRATLPAAVQMQELREMRALQDLTIVFHAFPSQVELFLSNWPCPSALKFLTLLKCPDLKVLHGLAAGKFASLVSLTIWADPGFIMLRAEETEPLLEMVPPGLPNLKSLLVYGTSVATQLARVLSQTRPTRIPELRLVCLAVLLDSSLNSGVPPDYQGYEDCLKLVRRAPQPLHVVLVVSCQTEEWVQKPFRCRSYTTTSATLLSRHFVTDTCDICLEAESFSGQIGIQKRVQVGL